MSNNNEIILRIRKALLKKRMTQRDLAAALGKNEAEISHWMSGRMGISEPNLQRIEDVLETALTKESLACEKSTYMRIGVIGTGSIAKRFVEEAVHVTNVYVAAAYNPMQMKHIDSAMSSVLCMRLLLQKTCSNEWMLSISRHLSIRITSMRSTPSMPEDMCFARHLSLKAFNKQKNSIPLPKRTDWCLCRH